MAVRRRNEGKENKQFCRLATLRCIKARASSLKLPSESIPEKLGSAPTQTGIV